MQYVELQFGKRHNQTEPNLRSTRRQLLEPDANEYKSGFKVKMKHRRDLTSHSGGARFSPSQTQSTRLIDGRVGSFRCGAHLISFNGGANVIPDDPPAEPVAIANANDAPGCSGNAQQTEAGSQGTVVRRRGPISVVVWLKMK